MTTLPPAHAILDALPNAIIGYDRELRVTAWNAATARGNGVAREDAIGKSLLELFPYIRGTAIEEEYRRALAGEVVDGRDRCWTPTGAERPRWFDVCYLPLRDAAGAIVGGVVTTTDVTARREAREELAEERRLLRTVIDAAPVGLLAVDASFVITEWNSYAERTTGLRRTDAVGRHLLSVLPDLAGTQVFRDYESALAGRMVSVRGRWYDVMVDGHRCYDALFVPLHDGRGTTTGAVMMALDVTERANAEAALLEDRERAERASRAKSEFLAGMSHELRTPLGAVIGFAQLLRDGKAGPLTDTQREYLDDVLVGARHLRVVVDDTLDLARIEAGIIDIRPRPVDLEGIVDETIATVAPLAAERGVKLERAIDPRAREIVSDAARVRQVLLNYVTNAIKFSERGGRVTIGVAPEGDARVRLAVSDRGRGIAESDIPRLFVEFQRLGVQDVAGSGLGLAVTRRIVESLGGTVGVESAEGAGSTFHAVLPRVYGAELAGAESSGAREGSDGASALPARRE